MAFVRAHKCTRYLRRHWHWQCGGIQTAATHQNTHNTHRSPPLTHLIWEPAPPGTPAAPAASSPAPPVCASCAPCTTAPKARSLSRSRPVRGGGVSHTRHSFTGGWYPGACDTWHSGSERWACSAPAPPSPRIPAFHPGVVRCGTLPCHSPRAAVAHAPWERQASVPPFPLPSHATRPRT